MKIDFKGQTVLITGATRGIGACMADHFESLGAALILTGTDQKKIEGLNKKASRKREYVAVDFSSPKETREFAKDLERRKRIDVCINNAGINRINPVTDLVDRDIEDILNINLAAPAIVLRSVARVMREKRYGKILNVGSVFGVVSKEKRSLYSMSKFGLNGLTAAASIELASGGILVNTLSPGFVDTELTRKILSSDDRKKMAARVPIGRFAAAEEIARVAIFLCSRQNTYLTGQNIIVDGGFVNA